MYKLENYAEWNSCLYVLKALVRTGNTNVFWENITKFSGLFKRGHWAMTPFWPNFLSPWEKIEKLGLTPLCVSTRTFPCIPPPFNHWVATPGAGGGVEGTPRTTFGLAKFKEVYLLL